MRLKTFARRHPAATGILALALVALTVFWPLLTGRALFFGDLELYFYPLTEFWHRELIQGRLPLWNPHLFSGVSFVGDPQIGLLYPPSALLIISPTIPALMISTVLHLWLSGAIFLLWMRRGYLKIGAPASFLGALCWMLGGAFISKSQFPNMLAALSWLPAILWATENLARHPNFRAATILGAILGVQLLAAHAQVSLYSIYLAFFYALWNWKISKSGALWKVASGFAFALILAALLDAGQMLPVIENLRGAERQVLSLQTAPRFILPIWAVTNFFAPYVYGNPNSGTWTFHGGGNAWETACYLGFLPFCLAIFGFKRGKFWIFAALLNIVLALGPVGGFYILAFKAMPGISRFHDAARFLMLAGISLSILAALGLQKLQENPKMRRFVPLVLLLSALDLGLYARNFYPLRPVSQIAPQKSFIGVSDEFLRQNQGRIWTQNPKIGRGLLIHYGDYRTRTPQNDAIFARGGIPNTQIWNGLWEAGGYDPIAPAAVAARLKSLEILSDASRFSENYASKLGQDSIRFFSLWRKTPLAQEADLPEIYRGAPIDGMRLFVYRNQKCLPRVRQGKIGVATANFYSLEANAEAKNLVIADNFSPSWSAFAGAQKLEIEPASRGFMRLREPQKAPRNIRMVYAPQSFRLGVFVSLCALSFVVAGLVATKNRKRNESLPVQCKENDRAPSL